ncbi:MAG: carboxypeptidase-like regulatory domain-containing protein [Bacillota bacterium]|nr:carboxypeptidase-like regulatory domain-containing protein [Bacillota bacterium]
MPGFSGSTGAYTVTLAPGTYTVGVQKEGYVPQVKSGVVVTSGKTTQVDFSLREAKILVYDDGQHHFATEALTNLGYTFTETNDFTAFNDAMAAQGWQLIVVDNPSSADP